MAAEWAGGEWVWAAGGGAARSGGIDGVTMDSREAGGGVLFFALKGEKRDGHEFVRGVVEPGGLAVVRRDWDAGGLTGTGGVLRVEDPLAALSAIAGGWRREMKQARVIGVTGSSGKTSTKELIANVLGRLGPTERTSGNFNNHIGVPLSVSKLERETRFGVFEAGVSHPGEMVGLRAVMRPDSAVVTNIGVAHMEAFGSQRAIAEEKGQLLAGLPSGGIAVLGREAGEFELLREMAGGAQVVAWGAEEGGEEGVAYTMAEGTGERKGWMRVRETGSGEEQWLPVPPPGGFMAKNAMAAVAIGRHFGAGWEEIGAALAEGICVKMRWERVELGGGRRAVNDAYNANPDSMLNAIRLFAKESGEKYLALGGMRELGAGALEAHRATGRAAAAAGKWAGVVTVGSGEELGPLADALEEGFREGGVEAVRTETHEAAAQWLAGRMGEGDCVLLKGSRGATMEKVLDFLKK